MADPRPPRKRMRGQCSSDDNYDVFLNHRGPDVKAGFIAHLHDALQSVGLNSFLDKKSLVKGGSAGLSIDAALEAAKVHVAVVSRGYADSTSCLTELAAMIRSEKPVIPVFYDVEPADMRRVENGQFREAFEKHKSRWDAQQVAEWAAALEKLADITGFCLSHYEGDEAELKHEVVDEIQRLLPMNKAVQLEQYYVGLNENVKKCVAVVRNISNSTGLLCLAGMGGIGKTALAREIFNHFVGDKSFIAMCFLEIGRGTPSSSMTSLQQKLLWDLLRIPEQNHSQSYKGCFNKLSRQGPVLIVLDDIYDKVQYDMIIVNKDLLASGSCIIVTSRDQHVLTLISGRRDDVYVVKPLGCENSLKLFNWHAFGEEEAPHYFKVKAHDVSKACGGLPLALKVVGSSLFHKTSDEDIWEEAKDALKGDPNVINALKWSYDCLSEAEKLMFVDIACVFYGWTKRAALDIWKSCKDCSCCAYGLVPSTSLTSLIDKSLIVLDEHPTSISDEKVLVMHGLLRDIGQGIGKDINGSHLWGKKAIQAIEDNHQESNKIKSLDLSNSQNQIFHAESLKKMANLHFLILDGCGVSGSFMLDSKELRWLRWKCMPMTHLPSMLNLSNLTSLDFSQSTKLAVEWTTANPALEACPNLLKLNLNDCTSITTLPDSLGHLPRLQVLELYRCGNLEKLPNSIGHLTALQKLLLERCGKLEALPDTITALSSLQLLDINFCSSISKLPASFGHMIGLTRLYIDLAADWQVMEVGQLNKLTELGVTECTDEVITLLDNLKTLANLKELSELWFYECPSITNLPQTIVLLPKLEILDLWRCEKLQELHANSIRELKMLKRLSLRYCNSVETLPESLGALRKLEEIWIVKCSSMSKLPMSMGQLPSLKTLHLQSCTALRSFPDSFRHLTALQNLQVVDCGSLSGFELVRVLHGLRIWGCTSIKKLPEQGLYLVDSNFRKPECLYNYEEWDWVRRNAKELDLVEDHGCGFLRNVQDTETGLEILQRVHKSPCCDERTV